MSSIIANLLSERSNFIIIGLTGRTGSGCSTAAQFLSDVEFNAPLAKEAQFRDSGKSQQFFTGLNKNRYDIVRSYAEENHYPFKVIKVSDMISAHLIDLDKNKLGDLIHVSFGESTNIDGIENLSFIESNDPISELHKYILTGQEKPKEINESDLNTWLSKIKYFSIAFKKLLNESANKYTKFYQDVGDFIREFDSLKSEDNNLQPNIVNKSTNNEPQGLLTLPRMLNRVIKIYRKLDKDKNKENKDKNKENKDKNKENKDKYNKTYIVLDTIRNPYEAKYFKDRYASFYLVSINAPDSDRKKYLQEKYSFSYSDIEDMDIRESGERESKDKYSELIAPNVKRCIEISDIHIFNPRNEPQNQNVLKAQLIWYLSLMKHPGLITPTPLERVMQLAYTAKMNSGCISRQVGAVITDSDYSIKAIGWNDVAKGQVPCNLRSLKGVTNHSCNTTYSEYERNNDNFLKEARFQLSQIEKVSESGRSFAYCFKSIQNKIDGQKNQVHTRSLHAEENAFLQLAKYGSVGIEGGKLFTTASPCELCAKKAYQLGIKEVIYIDPYPGIAIQHILQIGQNPPNLVQFRGAVGKGYHNLYEPLMPYKDELDYLV
ncbi:anti-phage dCTP deaminase [Francisella salimarina]|uniref:CMP/dCMP-type deaminase domain-containing protein n=1 Tax=Francisella salimarina TaxID=2599927 RepID=A0AAJ4NN30_9GAMM|nr:anti-phage dCTP deaminase [Francisella salimarina]QWU98521.1 hypothetical protein KQR59_05245 [Francisella salimarina]